MKSYQFTLQVQDDFDPMNLDIILNYPGQDLKITDEGFMSFESFLDKVTANAGNITDSSVVFLKFPAELMNDPDRVLMTAQLVENQLGCTVLTMVDDFEVLCQNSAEAIDMLKKMIDKINLRSTIKIA